MERGFDDVNFAAGKSGHNPHFGYFRVVGRRRFSSEGAWFQVQWPVSWSSVHITVKELAPIVLATALWGK